MATKEREQTTKSICIDLYPLLYRKQCKVIKLPLPFQLNEMIHQYRILTELEEISLDKIKQIIGFQIDKEVSAKNEYLDLLIFYIGKLIRGREPETVLNVDPQFATDKDCVILACYLSPKIYATLELHLREDIDVLRAVSLGDYPWLFSSAGKLRDDPQVVMEKLFDNYHILRYASKRLLSDRGFFWNL